MASRAYNTYWLRSEEGRAWRLEQYKVMVDMECENCGGAFQVSQMNVATTKFCSPKCKAKARRNSGVDDEKRICVICEGTFVVNRYTKIKTCGEPCKSESRRRTMAAGH